MYLINSSQVTGSVVGTAAAATAASAESSESETDNNDERTNKFLLLVDQVSNGIGNCLAICLGNEEKKCYFVVVMFIHEAGNNLHSDHRLCISLRLNFALLPL